MHDHHALVIKNLTKVIGKNKIVDHVTIEIKPGEIFGLLGANGAGKTTIMRMVTGLIKPSAGQIMINGIDLAAQHEDALSEIGAIIESPDLYKHLSGQMNLKIMANMSRDVDDKRIEEVVAFVGLTNRIKDKVSKYSLGMRQRLGIASALLSNPKVLVLDEPLNGLDPDGVKEMRNTFLKLAREHQVSIIISSHILSEMEQVCDRFSIIDKGVLIETLDMSETNLETDQMHYDFEFLNEVDAVLVTNALSSMAGLTFELTAKGISVNGDKQTIAGVVNHLVKAEISVVSVTPHKKNLEEYFIQRVGEGNK